MSFHDTSTAWVRDVIDCLAAVAHDFEVVGYEEPERLLPNLSSVMVLLERMLILPAEELTDDTGEIFLKMRRSRWIQGIAQEYKKNHSDLTEEARQAQFTYKRMLAKSRVATDELIELEAFITSILVGLDEAVTEEIARQRKQELATHDIVDEFRRELSGLTSEELWEDLETSDPADKAVGFIGSADVSEKVKVLVGEIDSLVREKRNGDNPLLFIYIDALAENVHRYTVYGLPPYHPYPFGGDFDDLGRPAASSLALPEIRLEIGQIPGLVLVGEILGGIVVVRSPGKDWQDDGLDVAICQVIASYMPGPIDIHYEEEEGIELSKDDEDTSSIGS